MRGSGRFASVWAVAALVLGFAVPLHAQGKSNGKGNGHNSTPRCCESIFLVFSERLRMPTVSGSRDARHRTRRSIETRFVDQAGGPDPLRLSIRVPGP